MKDLNRAFPETPASIRYAVAEGLKKGEEAMKKRHKILTAAGIAAVFVLLTAAAAFAAVQTGKTRTDRAVLTQQPAQNREITDAGESPALYRDEEGTFHLDPNCVSGETPVSRDEIEEDSLAACETCVEPFVRFCMQHSAETDVMTETDEPAVYCTAGGQYYHLEADCSGMTGAYPCAESEAQAKGKVPCPVCCILHSAAEDGIMMEMGAPVVYCTEGGQYFHLEEDCSGMTGAHECTVNEAQTKGKVPCPVCCSGEGSILYMTSFPELVPQATPEPTPEPIPAG